MTLKSWPTVLGVHARFCGRPYDAVSQSAHRPPAGVLWAKEKNDQISIDKVRILKCVGVICHSTLSPLRPCIHDALVIRRGARPFSSTGCMQSVLSFLRAPFQTRALSTTTPTMSTKKYGADEAVKFTVQYWCPSSLPPSNLSHWPSRNCDGGAQELGAASEAIKMSFKNAGAL